MSLINSNDVSLVCRFNVDANSLPLLSITSIIESVFQEFGFEIKKFYYSNSRNVYTPRYAKFKTVYRDDMSSIETMSYQSDFDRKDFEPHTRLDVDINMLHIESRGIIKINVVINDHELLKNVFNTYKRIVTCICSKTAIRLSGYSFLLPNNYGAISFSSGILRKMNMPCALKNLARWYPDADVINSTICLVNCFSNLTEYQNQCLTDIFGESNVYQINNVTVIYNSFAENMNISDYIVSNNYNELCDAMEELLPFKRLDYCG